MAQKWDKKDLNHSITNSQLIENHTSLTTVTGSNPVLGTESNNLEMSPLRLLNGLNSLKMAQKWDKGLPYRKPKLADRGGDLSKRWYVSYYYWSAKKGALVRGKISKIPGLPSPNKEKTLKKRYSEFKVLLEAVDILLSKGWTPEQKIDLNAAFGVEQDVNNVSLPILEALGKALKYKYEEVSKRTADNYRRAGHNFQAYLRKKGLHNKQPDEINRSAVYDWLLNVSRGKSGKTRNNYLNDLSTLFEKMIELELASRNPCKGIKEVKEVVNRHQAYTAKELRAISEYLRREDPSLVDFIHFIGYAFLRPNEIISLKRKSINLEKGVIFLEAESAKRKHSEVIPLIDRLLPTVHVLIEQCSSENDFLFGNERKPGPKPVYRSDAFSERWNKHRKNINKEFGTKLNQAHTLYGMRHTFIQDIYQGLRKTMTRQEAEFKIQPITRHQTVEALRKYIRDYNIEVAEDWSDNYSLRF